MSLTSCYENRTICLLISWRHSFYALLYSADLRIISSWSLARSAVYRSLKQFLPKLAISAIHKYSTRLTFGRHMQLFCLRLGVVARLAFDKFAKVECRSATMFRTVRPVLAWAMSHSRAQSLVKSSSIKILTSKVRTFMDLMSDQTKWQLIINFLVHKPLIFGLQNNITTRGKTQVATVSSRSDAASFLPWKQCKRSGSQMLRSFLYIR